ncbi:MAG: ATP-binding cassette domain-containing protein [Proteobacteria bacterium]|nr:ATP-binding cassette domain-containing protein [Pseudomonadota bacterium]
MIRFDNVSYTYQTADTPAVFNLNFELEEGSFHYLTGASGAGKTTIFRMLYMDILPTAGELHIFGRNVAGLERDDIARLRRRMGILFQDFRLLDHLTVRENVSLPLSLQRCLTPEEEKCVAEILDWVGLGQKMDQHPAMLSGGEKQRAAIARAVVNRPALLIADEPTGNVDQAMGRRIMHLFNELNRHGTTILIATHDQQIIKDFPAPALHIAEGQVSVRKVA